MPLKDCTSTFRHINTHPININNQPPTLFTPNLSSNSLSTAA
jgi:hypothetical protein